MLLKRLSEAIGDGDHIYGVVRGSSLNAGGKTNGYTVPNPSAQGEVIREAIERAGVNARSISYIEAHGTGTLLGDPIEIAGLTRAFGGFYSGQAILRDRLGEIEYRALRERGGDSGADKSFITDEAQAVSAEPSFGSFEPEYKFQRDAVQVQRELRNGKASIPG